MKKLVVVSVILASTWSVTGLAHATHVAVGETCGFSSLTDPLAPNVQVGSTYSGSVTATGLGAPVVVTCTVQVGAVNLTHAGPDAAVAVAAGTQTAALPPTLISYLWPVGVRVFFCTEWTVAGTSYYYDAPAGVFSTSNTAQCASAVMQQVGLATWSHSSVVTVANI